MLEHENYSIILSEQVGRLSRELFVNGLFHCLQRRGALDLYLNFSPIFVFHILGSMTEGLYTWASRKTTVIVIDLRMIEPLMF